MNDRDSTGEAGVCVVDKPAGITSLDVLRRLKKRMSGVRMGHTGTLDPIATGVLVVCVGEATKLISYMQLEPKKYRGSLQLGLETDSWDITGKVVERQAVPPLTTEGLFRAFTELEGQQHLETPAFSAIKYRGRPLYTYARKGQAVNAPPRKAFIEAFRLLSKNRDIVEFEMVCSRGTYVRSVVQSVGKRLGCGACLSSLKRLQCGRFRIQDALPLDAFDHLVEKGLQSEVLFPPAEVLDHLGAYEIEGKTEKKVRHGIPLRHTDLKSGEPLHERIGEKFRIMIQGELVAVAEVRRDPLGIFLQPIRVLRRAA